MNNYRLMLGDCLELTCGLADNSLHAVCTDPPYGLVEFSPEEIAKLRSGRGGIWRLPPDWDGCKRKPLPRFSILTFDQKNAIEEFFVKWAAGLKSKLRPGGHILMAGNPTLQMYVQNALVQAGFESRATILRIYHGFRGGDRPKNAEAEFPEVCVTPRGNYEPWMLFRKPISEKTVAQNLRKWGTGGLRMLEGGKPLPDVIPSFKTPSREREIVDHPSLKPQHLLRIFVRALLPLDEGVILDPFFGSGSTIAAASSLGLKSVGMEIDPHYYKLAEDAIPRLAALYPDMKGGILETGDVSGYKQEIEAQLQLLEATGKYRSLKRRAI
jgi:DNA modification methylase